MNDSIPIASNKPIGFIEGLFVQPMTLADVIGYFIAISILIYMTNITYRRRNELWTGLKGDDGQIQTVEMLIAEYLIIMPAIILSSAFLKVKIEKEVWDFLNQITLALLAGKTAEHWVNNHYKPKSNDTTKETDKSS